ncbi:mRNA-decapping enzyme subunit 2 [Ascosphaera aggregata]|nr:mRNA-decapping enzyme subunit 2 [Ascosphaera aggregata]
MSIRLQRTWACARTIRCFSTSQRLLRLPPAENIPKASPPADAGYVKLPNRALLELSGDDATHFLQGLVMQDVIPTSRESDNPLRMYYTAMLNTRGRIMWDIFIYRFIKTSTPRNEAPKQEIAYYIEVDKLELAALRTQITKRKLRAKVKWKVVSPNNLSVYAAWKKPTSAVWETKEWKPPAWNFEVDEYGVPMTFVDPRAPHFGFRILAKPDQLENNEKLGPQATLIHYQIRRYECGIPEGANEVFYDGSMPMETNFDATDSISFTKGCYVGQELTHRTRHGGIIRKRILPIALRNEDDPEPTTNRPIYDPSNKVISPTTGAKLHIADTLAGRRAGHFIRSVGNVGLGLCHLPVMTDIQLIGVMSTHDPTRKIIISDSQNTGPVKAVKAYVPPWLRDFIANEERSKTHPLEGKARRIGSGKIYG